MNLILILILVFSFFGGFEKAFSAEPRANRKPISRIQSFIKSIPTEEEVLNGTIPKIIHQIWVGSKIPERFVWMAKTWEEKHPDWEYILWTDDKVENLSLYNREEYDQAVNFGVKADILRYELLNQFGGIYADIDYECLKAFDPILGYGDFFSCMMNGSVVTNALIGCVPGHPIIQSCVEQLKGKDTKVTRMGQILALCGPNFLTERIRQYVNTNDDKEKKISLFEKGFSFPMPSCKRTLFWKGKLPQQELEGYRSTGAYAIHYWAISWQ